MDIDWMLVIGMVLIIEGLLPLLFPKAWQGYVGKLAAEPVSAIRQVGGFLFVIGLVLIWLR